MRPPLRRRHAQPGAPNGSGGGGVGVERRHGLKRLPLPAASLLVNEEEEGGGAGREAATRPRVFVPRPAARPPRLPPGKR